MDINLAESVYEKGCYPAFTLIIKILVFTTFLTKKGCE